jgi:uncharacterized protein
VVLTTLAVGAVDWKALKPQGCASDFAGVIESGSRQQLERYCQEVERSTTAQIAVVIIPSLQGEPIEDVARTIFRAWGIGNSHKNEGVLILFAIGERRSRLEVGDGLKIVLPGGLEERVLVEMRPAVRREQYGEAILAAASTIGGAIARAKQVSLKTPLTRQIRSTVWDLIPWPVLLGAFVLLTWLTLSGGTRGYSGSARGTLGSTHAGFLPGLSSIISRATWGSRGSGGFGGYDSDDSFGGLGGGSNGGRVRGVPGGGASSDW